MEVILVILCEINLKLNGDIFIYMTNLYLIREINIYT